jgi:hypothetical protein
VVLVAPFTGFGGYQESGTVTSIGAQWRVPTISRDSVPGDAATWIGSQNTTNNQLIQVGVIETYTLGETVRYEAFWSDLAVGYAAQTFGEVGPGDVVSVSMTRDNSGWTLRLVDKSRHLTGRKFITFPERTPFTVGEWVQEDPSPAGVSVAKDVPYPTLSNVSFQDLTFNGKVPRLGLDNGSVLITSDGFVRVPSAVVDGAFTLTAPTGNRRQYLGDEQKLDVALSGFDAQLQSWRSTSPTMRATVMKSMYDAFAFDATTLSAQAWPPSSRTAVTRLVQSDRRQETNLTAWASEGYATNAQSFSKFQDELTRNVSLVDSLRTTLRLPPI